MLAVRFQPAQYSTVSLRYFYPDWQGYTDLVLDVVNPESTDIKVTLRIHDRLHAQHAFAFNDRFNRQILIKPGKQRIVIALADIKNAPATRQMDMRHIQDLSLFTIQSITYHHLDIQKILLE